MIDFVADAKIKPFAFGGRKRSFAPAMEMLQCQIDIRRARFHPGPDPSGGDFAALTLGSTEPLAAVAL
jgi:hypothetical protein